MSKIHEIKSAQLTARKNKDTVTASLLTTLIGEAEMDGKNAGNRAPTDEEVLAKISKFMKNNNEFIKSTNDAAVQQKLNDENAILGKFLPTKLEEQEIQMIVDDLLAKGNKLGDIMKIFKQNYANRYDAVQVKNMASK